MFFDNLNALGLIMAHKIEWSFALLHWKHTTTIHNVSNHRNSTLCRILHSRYGERNVPNVPRRLKLNKKLIQEVWTWDSDEKIMGNIPLFFMQSLAMGGYNRHSFVTHFFLSLISFCHSGLRIFIRGSFCRF
jgi:hypothetical protein